MLYSSNPDITVASLRETYTVPTRDDLKAALGERATDKTGSKWSPIHHADLIEQIEKGASDAGLVIAKQEFELSDDQHDIFGCLTFESPDWFDRDDMGLVLGFRNSNVQRMRLMGVTGSRVFICANGMIAGDFVFGFKNTTGNRTDAEVKVAEGMQNWETQARSLSGFVDHMKSCDLSEAQADNLILEGMRRGVYSSSQIGKIDTQYRSFADEGNQYNQAFGDRNAWSLYNAVTEVGKGTARSRWSPSRVETALKNFPRLIADVTGYQGLSAPAESVSLN